MEWMRRQDSRQAAVTAAEADARSTLSAGEYNARLALMPTLQVLADPDHWTQWMEATPYYMSSTGLGQTKYLHCWQSKGPCFHFSLLPPSDQKPNTTTSFGLPYPSYQIQPLPYLELSFC